MSSKARIGLLAAVFLLFITLINEIENSTSLTIPDDIRAPMNGVTIVLMLVILGLGILVLRSSDDD